MSKFGYVRVGPRRYRERFGLSFEDVELGMRIRHRPGVDVSQQDNRDDSVELLNNAHLHYDSQYAAHTEWCHPLSVSTMTVQRFLALVSRSWYRRRAIIGIDSIALTRPVIGDDTLYSESTVTALDGGADPDVGLVCLDIAGKNRQGDTVARISCTYEIYRRGRHPEDDPQAPPAEEERFSLYHMAADGALVEQTGLVFEDLAPEETFVHWPGRTVRADESRRQALRSLEINPRWHDEAYLRKYVQIKPAIYEPLVIGIVTALTTRTFGRVVANLGWTDIVLPRPVRPGETIYAESTVRTVRASNSRPDQGIATVETRGLVENGDLVCRYQRALLIYRRGAGPYQDAGY